MTWWSAILATVVPALIAGGIALLTWKSLRHQQTATAAHEQSQADSLGSTTLADLRRQVDSMWQDRNRLRDDLARALQELARARDDLAKARDDLVAAAQDIARLRSELDRARERITLLEREVARLGGNPLQVGV